jgi:hypothetical protein
MWQPCALHPATGYRSLDDSAGRLRLDDDMVQSKDRVGPLGKPFASMNAHGPAFGSAAGVRESNRKRAIGASAYGLIRAHGETVYGSPIKRRQIDRHLDVLGKDAAGRICNVNHFRRQLAHLRVDPRQHIVNARSTRRASVIAFYSHGGAPSPINLAFMPT